MSLITKTTELTEFCQMAKQHPFVTIDTEFLRERTYFAKLCLVQLAVPGDGEEGAVAVDVLAEGLSLEPLKDLLAHDPTVKIFHAAKQDLEIFHQQLGILPQSFFDTQIAAMVCGFGNQVGYEPLVRKLLRRSVDKSQRFTDWSLRPLSAQQLHYALADVTHLRDLYLHFVEDLQKQGRTGWVAAEMAALIDPTLYEPAPREVWKRLKIRNDSPRFLAVVRELAAFREQEAIRRDVPRARVMKDDALLEVAARTPSNVEHLQKLRLLPGEFRKGKWAEKLLEMVALGKNSPKEDWPQLVRKDGNDRAPEAVVELLKVLLKAKSEELGVAQILLASAADLEQMARGQTENIPAMQGWRYEAFGQIAQELIEGRLAMTLQDGKVRQLRL